MTLNISIAQMKSTSGDIRNNYQTILNYLQQAEQINSDLLILPEACLCGYPSGDLINRPQFIEICSQATQNIIAQTKNKHCAILFGTLTPCQQKQQQQNQLNMPYNSMLLAHNGKIIGTYSKNKLPNDDVFYEKRNFSPSPLNDNKPTEIHGVRLGIIVCNDMWHPQTAQQLTENSTESADILIVANGSPWHTENDYTQDKLHQRLTQARKRTNETQKPLIFVNAEGGQDDLIFDGQSFILNGNSEIALQAPAFDTKLISSTWQKSGNTWLCEKAKTAKKRSQISLLYQALVVGLKDYVHKSGFNSVVLGLSGGIDSALTAALAVDALGKDNVLTIYMPSTYSSNHSCEDALQLAENLAIPCHTISIEDMRQRFMGLMQDYPDSSGIAGENIQARLRGDILMFIANSTGKMLLATGNKSEFAMGYATLYGDMCGGFAPLMDVYKSSVFALSRWRNESHESYMLGVSGGVIPERVITKAPSAELRPQQKDEDSLPPYAQLDKMLAFLIENNGDWRACDEVSEFNRSQIDEIWKIMIRCEYKRSQAPVGLRVTSRGFGSGWRYPLAHGYFSEGIL